MAGVAVTGGVLERAHAGDAQVAMVVCLSEWQRDQAPEPVGLCGNAPRPWRFVELDRALGRGPDGRPLPTMVVARRLRVHAKQVLRWRDSGWLTDHQADVLATRAGFHPAQVWPDW